MHSFGSHCNPPDKSPASAIPASGVFRLRLPFLSSGNMLANDTQKETLMDNMKLSELKVGHFSGLALFVMGCIFFPFAMPFVGIVILWFAWLKHKDRLDRERWAIQRQEQQAEWDAA